MPSITGDVAKTDAWATGPTEKAKIHRLQNISKHSDEFVASFRLFYIVFCMCCLPVSSLSLSFGLLVSTLSLSCYTLSLSFSTLSFKIPIMSFIIASP